MGESGHLVGSFTLGMIAAMGLLIVLYLLFVAVTRRLLSSTVPFARWFSVLAFTTLPVAFSYHVAHNLSHFARETGRLGQVLADPLGLAAAASKPAALPAGQMSLLIPEQLLFALQAGMILIGFWLALQVLRHRALGLLGAGTDSMNWRLLPMVLFVVAAAGVNLFLLTQVMVMRL